MLADLIIGADLADNENPDSMVTEYNKIREKKSGFITDLF
jgi:hypothetical protein